MFVFNIRETMDIYGHKRIFFIVNFLFKSKKPQNRRIHAIFRTFSVAGAQGLEPWTHGFGEARTSVQQSRKNEEFRLR